MNATVSRTLLLLGFIALGSIISACEEQKLPQRSYSNEVSQIWEGPKGKARDVERRLGEQQDEVNKQLEELEE